MHARQFHFQLQTLHAYKQLQMLSNDSAMLGQLTLKSPNCSMTAHALTETVV